MKRYCQCGRPIWVVFRRSGQTRLRALYDGGSQTVWMPIAQCPHCGADLDPDTLDDYPLALRESSTSQLTA